MNPVETFLKVIDPLDDDFVFVAIDPNHGPAGPEEILSPQLAELNISSRKRQQAGEKIGS